MKVARTVRRGEVRKGLSYETAWNDLGKSEEQRYLAGPLPYRRTHVVADMAPATGMRFAPHTRVAREQSRETVCMGNCAGAAGL